jgi:hypothetical protein
MNGGDFRSEFSRRFQRVQYRIAALGAAGGEANRFSDFVGAKRSLKSLDVFLPQRDDDCLYFFTLVELPQRVNDDRRARDLDELFRSLPAESAAAAGGGNDCYVHGGG